MGDGIIVTAYGQRGTLLAQLKDKRWEAQVGLIKLTLKEDEFSLVKLKEEAQQPKKRAVKVVKKQLQEKGRALAWTFEASATRRPCRS